MFVNRDDYQRLCAKNEMYEKEIAKYQEKYWNELRENKKLQNENGYLSALFDKEADTQVIKYNGRLYKIVSSTHNIEAGAEEILDISLFPVRGGELR